MESICFLFLQEICTYHKELNSYTEEEQAGQRIV